jgi:hypothetical protein
VKALYAGTVFPLKVMPMVQVVFLAAISQLFYFVIAFHIHYVFANVQIMD